MSKIDFCLFGWDIPLAAIGDLSIQGSILRSTKSHITAEGLNNSSSKRIPNGRRPHG